MGKLSSSLGEKNADYFKMLCTKWPRATQKLWLLWGEHSCPTTPTPELPWGREEPPLPQHAGHSSAFIPVTTAPSSQLNNHAGPVPGPGTRWWTKQIPCSQRASTPHKSSSLVFIIAFGGDTVTVSEQSLDVRGFGARPACIPSSHAGCWSCKAWLGPRGTVWNSSGLG